MKGPLADYYHWEETGRGIHIYMHSAMADRLQKEVLDAAIGAGGGTETGGILLGHVQKTGEKPALILEDFVPVPNPHAGGPCYDLSGEDSIKLESELLRAALAGCESVEVPSILGYYRSHLREGISLSSADVAVIESYFQDSTNVFLLIKTVAGSQACTAAFFFWEDGHIQPEFSSLEVAMGRGLDPPKSPEPFDGDWRETPDDPALTQPLDFPVLPSDPDPLALPQASQSPVSAPAVTPPPPRPAPSVVNAPRQWPGILLRSATIVIATAALVIAVLAYLGAPRTPREEAVFPKSASGLGLRVERTPPDLLVSWDCSTREIASAQQAILTIRDGKIVRPPLNLNKKDIGRGSYLYTPASDDVQFRLEVFGVDGGSVAQSIRVSDSLR